MGGPATKRLVVAALAFLAWAAPAGAATLAERYAPLVYLHPQEELWPGNADRFLAGSRLLWAHNKDCGEPDLVATKVDAAALGAGRYAHDLASPLCPGILVLNPSNAFTRPFSGIAGQAGFALDLRDSLRRGDPSGRSWSAYFGLTPRRTLVYWLFYPASGAPGSPQVIHEGDWENVTIRLDGGNRPTQVAFFAHGRATICRWRDVEKSEGTHPVVLSGLGSHASFPPGLRPEGERVGRGRAWRTWERLANVRTRPWYGYGGAWGDAGQSSVTTGPLGPSRYKDPVPRDWSPVSAASCRATR